MSDEKEVLLSITTNDSEGGSTVVSWLIPEPYADWLRQDLDEPSFESYADPVASSTLQEMTFGTPGYIFTDHRD